MVKRYFLSQALVAHLFILVDCLIALFYLILHVPSTIFQLNRDGSS